MKEFIVKNKRKLSVILAIAILAVLVCVYALVNLPKKVAINKIDNEEIKAQQETVPEGYVGIYNADDLRNMANDLAGKYILMVDLDMAGETWTPIGTEHASAFTGTFEGNNHTISNLTIDIANRFVGMFGYINGGTVENLTLENVDITNTLNISGAEANTGGIAGYLYNGIIKNVEVSGTVTESIGTSMGSCMGGIVGQSSGNVVIITETTNTATVQGTKEVGGIIGKSQGAEITIRGVTNRGKVSGKSEYSYVGGIVGWLYSSSSTGTITEATNSGEVILTADYNSYVGGIVGRNDGKVTITKAINIGKINGDVNSYDGKIGGIVGYSVSAITKVTNSGEVIGTTKVKAALYVGGIAGDIEGAITEAKSIGIIRATRGHIGGIAGRTYR